MQTSIAIGNEDDVETMLVKSLLIPVVKDWC